MPPGQAHALLGAPLASLARSDALAALPAIVATSIRYAGLLLPLRRRVSVPGRSKHEPDRCAAAAARGRLSAGHLSAQRLYEQLRARLLRAQQLLSGELRHGYGGYGVRQLCNRYANGVVYQVDCYSGMVEDVVPLYAGGYGVGPDAAVVLQLLQRAVSVPGHVLRHSRHQLLVRAGRDLPIRPRARA